MKIVIRIRIKLKTKNKKLLYKKMTQTNWIKLIKRHLIEMFELISCFCSVSLKSFIKLT